MTKSSKKKRTKSIPSGQFNFDLKTLTSFLTSAGLASHDASAVADIFMRWYQSNGASWVNSRIKELRQWYENYLAGTDWKPSWFSYTKAGVPKGPLGSIFRLPLQGALLALSVNTLLFEDKDHLSSNTIEKELKALKGNGYKSTKGSRELMRDIFGFVKIKKSPKTWDFSLTLPSDACIPMGKTIPIQGGRNTIKVNSRHDKAQAYIESWKAVPDVTIEYLQDQGHLDWVPISVVGDQTQLHLDTRPYGDVIGRIGLVCEPQMKTRFPAMVNAITQACLKPLGDLWYGMLASLETDSYLDQASGAAWVKDQLAQGVTLAGVDMTSASDLLSLEQCLEIIDTVYFYHLRDDEDYKDAKRHFLGVSRGLYYSEELGGYVRWEQGQPLGSYPSFALLGLVNNALARLAHFGTDGKMRDTRVTGDDIVLTAEAVDLYSALVEVNGGEINRSKTIVSNKLVEFVGHVITPDTIMSKAIHLKKFSDDSFMSYASQIGPKARRYLLPKQRKLWDIFKYVPGVILGLPWNPDSLGEPLSLRYTWFLEQVKKINLDPDLEVERSVGENLQALIYYEGLDHELDGDTVKRKERPLSELILPWPISETDYQSVEGRRIPSGDPRKWKLNGKSLRLVLEQLVKEPTFTDYLSYKSQSAIHSDDKATS